MYFNSEISRFVYTSLQTGIHTVYYNVVLLLIRFLLLSTTRFIRFIRLAKHFNRNTEPVHRMQYNWLQLKIAAFWDALLLTAFVKSSYLSHLCLEPVQPFYPDEFSPSDLPLTGRLFFPVTLLQIVSVWNATLHHRLAPAILLQNPILPQFWRLT